LFPAGQVGLWCSDNSDNNYIESYGSLACVNTIVRRGCRVDEYVATGDFKWNTSGEPGIVVRWLDPLDPTLRRQGQAGNWSLTRRLGHRPSVASRRHREATRVVSRAAWRCTCGLPTARPYWVSITNRGNPRCHPDRIRLRRTR
jgi:hypothetical protein